MSEVIKRDKRLHAIRRLHTVIQTERANATPAKLAVWQRQMAADWASFENAHDAVLDRAGAKELAEQQEIYDAAYATHYAGCVLVEERLMQVQNQHAEAGGQVEDDKRAQHQLILRQTTLARRLETACARVIGAGDNLTACQADVHRSVIEPMYAAYQASCMELIANGANQGEVGDAETVIDEVYMAAAELLMRCQGAQQQQGAAAVQHGPDALKVPQLIITPFDGRFETWEAFRESFLHGIHQRANLPAVQKLQYLKTVLRGEPEELIRNFGLTEENYASAWALLNTRYNNQRELIAAHLRVLTSFSLCSASADDLRSLANKTASTLMALRNMGRPVDQWNDWIVFHVCEKIDRETRQMWEQAQAATEELPTWAELDRFLQGRIRALSCAGLASTSSKSTSRPPQQRSTNIRTHQTSTTQHVGAQDPEQQHVCPVCDGAHLITFCSQFRSLSVPERRRMAAERSWCFVCLKSGHLAQHCRSTRGCQTCGAKHNSMLHAGEDAMNEQQVRSNLVSCTTAVKPRQRPPVLLATALVMVRDAAGDWHQVRALLDQGGDASFVSEQLAQTLQATRYRETGELSAISGVNAGRVEESIMIQVGSCKNAFEISVNAFVLSRVTGELAMMPDIDVQRWPHIVDLELADPEFMAPHAVQLALGSDVYGKLLLPDVRHADGLPTAQQTQLGWIVSGGIENRERAPEAVRIHTHHVSIDAQLARFWEIEETSGTRHLTEEEEKCEAMYAETVSSDDSGRLHVRLPMKHEQVIFGESQRFAVQRQLQLERRFSTNPAFAESYRQFMLQYEQLGHMREVGGAAVDLTRSRAMLPPSKREYYIPHHAVIKEASSTTKLRVVFDASRRTTNGLSLNEQMMVGPRLQEDLTAIMMRWRKYRVAFCSDVEKMYRQIVVDEPDADLQRIVWRPRADMAMKVYQLTTVTYGTASAPYLAVKCLQTLAHRERERFPIGSTIALNNFYVDDVLGGADTVAECIEAQSQLCAIMASGGMKLRKWASNSADALAMIQPADRECSFPLSIDDSANISTLGVQWNPASGELSFKINAADDNQPCTKRAFLSAAARLFDPLGWLAPCTIVIKMLFQSLWKLHIDWDDEMPHEITKRWIEINTALHLLKELRIPRWIGTTGDCEIEVHGFCDASMDAYAAVVYARVSSASTETRVFNLAAKTKVAPIKVVSLPRLELCGAALLVKLIADVRKAMQWSTVAVRCWTDSTIVLAWLRGHPSAFNVFVANRTAEIQRQLPIEHWQHVTSSDNPADCASRGIQPKQLLHHRLWWTGPQWLREDRSEWPQQAPIPATTEEARLRANTSTAKTECWDLITHYSSWSRLVRVTAWCIRFTRNCRRRRAERTVGTLQTAELMHTREFWIKSAQAAAYRDELHCLRQSKPISKSSSLRAINPVFSADGVMCVGGRLTNARGLSQTARTPAIVPRRSALSALLVRDAHQQTLHGGPTLMLAYLRRAVWIVDGPNEVRHYVQKCTTCFRHSARPEHQMMAALPSARVMPSRPFQHCAMDYSGALMVRSAKGRGQHATKAYVAVFVCLTTKAVHIELVGDLTTSGFIAAYERFISRRGCCSHLYSDNATNFVGAATFLRTERERFNATVQTALASKGTTWHFSPPVSPHFNGLAESAIRGIKHHIRRVIGETKLTFEEMLTVLTKIEACLNSRPLCPMNSDPDNFDALTPGHFLVGEPLTVIPQRDLEEIRASALTRWQLTQQIVQRIWRRWSSDYLHTLQQRRKWQQPTDNIRIGDMVLLIEDNLPPAKWAIGRICDVHPGDDTHIRVVTVRARGSTFRRSIVKVARLPIDDSPTEIV